MKKDKYPKRTVMLDEALCDNTDFTEKKIDGEYDYLKSSLPKRLLRFLLWRIVAPLPAFIYTKLVMRDKYIGKEKLKSVGGRGYFLYGNHTHGGLDAISPHILIFPKYCYLIASSKNMSMPLIGSATTYLGVIPLPTERSAVRNFSSAVEKRIVEGSCVVVYPEAHLLPYFTEIREFDDTSFSYPVRLGAPVFSMTRVYKKGRLGVKRHLYIDGPFYPDESLCAKDARAKLCREVREAMENRTKLSDVEVIRYER